MEKFQLALYLIQPDDMKQFCQDHSVNLFNILVDSITRADGRPTSNNHTHLQEQRVVGLLHTLAYFRYFNHLSKHLNITVHQHFSLRDTLTMEQHNESPFLLCQHK